MAKQPNFFQKLLGIELPENNEDQKQGTFQLPESPRPDGAIEIDASNFLQFGTTFDYQIPEDETQLITKYREIAEQAEFARVVDEIANEFFAYDDDGMPVQLDLDKTKFSESIKKKITDEFDSILKMLNFQNDAYEVFIRWYIDGRLYYHKVIDENNKKKGILQLKYIDPRKIKKVRKIINDKGKPVFVRNDVELNKRYEEFFIYNPKGINGSNIQGVPISKDSITYIHSGKFSKDNKTVVSNIHKSIRWFNTLRNIEDAIVIYRISRASEKRVFNIELGDLPQAQAEAHMKKVIDKFRKRISYNPQTGEVIEQKRYMTMLEDFWFAKRNGQGTTVDFLQGGQNLGDLEDVEYFKKRFYESLSVPITRLDPTTMFSIGRSSEITREELKFKKFISRLRKRFSFMFEDILRTQLLLKNIISEADWNANYHDIKYDFLEDNFFSELKETEIWQNRFAAARDTGIEGALTSKLWVKKNILKFTDEEIEEDMEQMQEEAELEAAMAPPEEGEEEGDDVQAGVGPDQPPAPPKKAKPKADNDEDDDDVLASVGEVFDSNQVAVALNELNNIENEDKFYRFLGKFLTEDKK